MDQSTSNSAYGGMESYYAASANAAHRRPRVEGDISCSVCVVGGGFTGMSAALELAEKGHDVIVVEAERVGCGASGRNGGQLVNGYSRSLGHIGRRYGAEMEKICGSMALEGAQIIRDRVNRFGIDCDLVDGGIIAAINENQMGGLKEDAEEWHRNGHKTIRILDSDAIREHVGSDRYIGALLDPEGGHFHPLNYVLGEAAAFERLGGRIYENSRVLGIEKGKRPSVRTGDGSINCDYVLVCGNAYLGNAVPELTARIMPVSSQIIATEKLDKEVARALLPTNHCIEDARYVLDYYRLSADNRLIYGGGTVYGARNVGSIVKRIRPGMLQTFPHLAGTRIDYAWSGNFALTLTRIPQVGRLSDNILFSHGDSGHGVTTTQLLGRLLSEAVDAQADRFDAFASFPYIDFPGGRLFRLPATVVGSWYYSFRDRLGI